MMRAARGGSPAPEKVRDETLLEVRKAIPQEFWGRGSTWPDGTDPYYTGGQTALKCIHSILDRLEEMPDAERIQLSGGSPAGEPEVRGRQRDIDEAKKRVEAQRAAASGSDEALDLRDDWERLVEENAALRAQLASGGSAGAATDTLRQAVEKMIPRAEKALHYLQGRMQLAWQEYQRLEVIAAYEQSLADVRAALSEPRNVREEGR